MVFDYMDGSADVRSACVVIVRHSTTRASLPGLAGHDECDLSTSLTGRQLNHPFFSAPCAGQQMFHHEARQLRGVARGECALLPLFSQPLALMKYAPSIPAT